MANIKIVGWTYFDSEYPTKKLDSGEIIEVIALIQNSIAENGYVFSGAEHQTASTGVPVFSDGTCFRASMRAWGSIMASIYVKENGEKCSYMDFYMPLGDDAIMPEYKVIDVEPAKVDEESIGCTTGDDREIVNQSLAMNMPFITTDKVLKKLYEKSKK